MKKKIISIAMPAVSLIVAAVLAFLTIFYAMQESFSNVYIIGSFSILLFIFTTIYDFLNGRKKIWFDYVSIGINFFVSVIICGFVIYCIQDATVQNIFLVLAAAIYGGLFTLVGVAWTIKWTQQENRIGHKDTIRPFFFNVSMVDYNKGSKEEKRTKIYGKAEDYEMSFSSENNHRIVSIRIGYFKNSDKTEFLLNSVMINNEIIPYNSGTQAIYKNEYFVVYVYCDSKNIKDFKNAYLLVEDADGNIIKLKITGTIQLLNEYENPDEYKLTISSMKFDGYIE